MANVPPKENQPGILIEMTKKVMVEEATTLMPLMAHILRTVARFPDVFYDWRDQFVPNVLAYLPKYANISHSLIFYFRRLNSSSRFPYTHHGGSMEYRGIMTELVDLLCYWEKKRRENIAAKAKKKDGDAMDVDTPSPAPPAPAALPFACPPVGDEWSLDLKRVEILQSFLIRAFSTEQLRTDGESLSEQAEALLHKVLEIWPEVPIKFESFEKLVKLDANAPALPATPPQPTQPGQPPAPDVHARAANGFRLISIVLKHQFDKFCGTYATRFSLAIPAALKTNNEGIYVEISSIVKLIVERIPDANDARVVEFYKLLHDGTLLYIKFQCRQSPFPLKSIC